jgi:hypothetical protein
MIKKLSIERFKSIRQLNIDCRRINLFIGEPNVGKSNILEALGFLSWCGRLNASLNEYVRIQLAQDLFYDRIVDQPILIRAHGDEVCAVAVSFERDGFHVRSGNEDHPRISIDYRGNHGGRTMDECKGIKAYRFRVFDTFANPEVGSLACPSGNNLVSLIQGSKALRDRVQNYFEEYGLRVYVKPHEKSIEIVKQGDGILIGYPYALVSDTLQRMVFFAAAMETNQGATLVFEEPEAHTFPYFTKQMGEEIGLETANQYFIATHNPYLLSAILEKADKTDVAVFVTYFKDFETKVRQLADNQLSEMLGGDPFFMSQRFVEEAW